MTGSELLELYKKNPQSTAAARQKKLAKKCYIPLDEEIGSPVGAADGSILDREGHVKAMKIRAMTPAKG